MNDLKFYWEKFLEILRENSLRSVLIHISIALGIFFLIIYTFYYIYLPIATRHGETITVPDLRGMTEQEVAAFLSSRDLRYEIADSTYVDSLPAGVVISQFPEANQLVKLQRKIYLTINTYQAPSVRIPNVFDVSRKNAELILKSVGLKIGKVEYEPDLAANAVLKIRYQNKIYTREDEAQGIRLPKGAVVDLILGDGLGTIDIEVPDVTGMLLTEAEELLAGIGLTIGNIQYIQSSDAPTGTILSQTPMAEKGTKIRIGSSLDLIVVGFEPQP
ncbi:MAG: PASTA domain-containing protein [Cytophagales bacterium]|nr:PASTA domain-containing protein [Cytophagales bacterium]MDW8384524.1 PASTA domain-containing protein [Flammeovirgaceae bacterium]